MGNPPTVDELLRRWQGTKDRDRPATIDDLCAGDAESPADLKERLQAVASMIAFLGIDTGSGLSGSRSTEDGASDRASPTVETGRRGG